MKLKTLALLAASAIGVNASALDLNGRTVIDTTSDKYPTVFTNDVYATSTGEVFRIETDGVSSLYTLQDGYLLDVENEFALGFVRDVDHVGGNFYRCKLDECQYIESRSYISGVDYFGAEMGPHLRATQNHISPTGESILIARPNSENSQSSNYQVSIVDTLGNILDSYPVQAGEFVYGSSRSYHPVGTTGITNEENFKLLSASHGEYLLSLKQWDSNSKQLQDIPLQTQDGIDLNLEYPDGLAPFGLKGPVENEHGELIYTAVIAKFDDKSGGVSSELLWGDFKIINGIARFVDSINSAPQSMAVYIGALYSNGPLFHSSDKFSFSSFQIDLSENGNTALTSLEAEYDTKNLINRIYGVNQNGGYIIREYGGNMFIFGGWNLSLSSMNTNIDPYLNPELGISLSAYHQEFYGVEATCSLQTTNATVDSNNYIDLSETALQIPIEWDSVTGEWKGAQSLTGLESLSGSKDFAQFDLTADVTTGTWTMNCSGIASDIEGNKIELNPAEITINLDDQIHGGSSVISGQIQIPNTTDYSGVVVTITLNGRQIEVTTMEDGSFEFDRLVEGDYTVHVYSEQYVAACNNLTLDGTNAAAPLTIEMYAGDINNDGAVDIGDFSYLSSLYSLSSADEQYDALADLNHDGIINVQDLSILGSHFGTDHCEVVPE